MKRAPIVVCFAITVIILPFGAGAQTKKPKKSKKTTTTVVTATPQPTPDPLVEEPPKRNERPVDDSINAKPNSRNSSNTRATFVPVVFYEFTRPGFTYSRVLIEHDEAGSGTISFRKDSFAELITDPIDLSAVTVARINEAILALNFLESNENYQYDRDYSHMGNITVTVKRAGRERTVKFNWTENKHARLLMDEYRRVSNEYTWRFEMITARANYPLQTPGLVDAVDSYLKRGEISDPPRLIPFLTELSTDERLPLMARNHAVTLVKQIEKVKK